MGKSRLSALCFLVLVLLFALAHFTLPAEESKDEEKKPSTKLEAFLSKKGELIVKNFSSLGAITGRYGANITIKALMIYTPGQESDTKKGLVIEVKEGGRYEKSNRSFLDIEEIESLSQALKYMIDLAKQWEDAQKEYTEVIFSTKGNFDVGFFQKGSDQTAFSTSGYVGEARCFLSSIADFVKMHQMVNNGLFVLK